jgi:regulator of replication initiation timing
MSNINELQEKLLNIDAQINSLIKEKSSVTAELESLKQQQAKAALDKVVEELKALNKPGNPPALPGDSRGLTV